MTALKSFLEIPYTDLEKINVEAKNQRLAGRSEAQFEKEYRTKLAQEDQIKAVTLCFCDIEGRFHMLDYDKKYFLHESENLTFDGSSVRGFSELSESDLRLAPQWSTLRWLPADIFGAGKVLIFTNILTKEKTLHPSDLRGQLLQYVTHLAKQQELVAFTAPEIEGFLLDGIDAEQNFTDSTGFSLISSGGYFHSLPQDRLRGFIDAVAEAQRALGFENEKDHPEVAPSQFELNFKYGPLVEICDQILLYKLICRQVAALQGMTASFLPKPISGINGSGMHINLSLWKKNTNAFYDKTGEANLSPLAHNFISRLLNHAPEICLTLNSSINAYRRLDPNFEAPNQIKVSPTDRGSMIRIPLGSPSSTRIEIRSVAPDANPYLVMYTLLKTGLLGEKLLEETDKRPRLRYLPSTMNEAIKLFRSSDFITKILGLEVQKKYSQLKQMVSNRNPKDLGTFVKTSEVIYHHEVTNQVLWNRY